jgi:uncharacterized membrane protein YoaK (UPF0700 family)
MNVALHAPSTIFSWRHVPSWMLLAFGAGSVNAGAFLACQSFVTHVTGTASRLGMDLGQWTLMLDYSLVLVCFIAGAMASVLVLEGRLLRGKEPLYALPLVLVSAVLVVVALAGRLGVFGPFGQSVEAPADFALLSLLSFAMGLQNAAVATTTGLAVRTTHMTGPATDLGIHLATSFFATGEARRSALRGAALRGGKLLAFILGGAVMLPVARAVGYLAFFVPAVIIPIAASLSFVPSRVRPTAPAPATA